ncbi:hypothetical protein Poli38472_003401 [Pythium oligandrum]|uniref:Protein HIRA n=1 Tax=Pythium oligandrum TaxID=41045 RepID=A0A8K1C6T4_PYTOL|nr:hypothetical protein Poli38472_003401 [Pythium oligandrum]|eukprot:TMW57476.1 hypothetical protein Poli38472_003401 [Pythium oligandrum]
MLVEKPEEVRHENAAGNASAIYGVDAHPSHELFATAGGDGSVKIWSLMPQQDGIATFELLATLSYHEQAVNCVRWAAHGRYLASGSDDQFVLLYELQPGAPPPVPFGSNAKPNKQNWVRCSTLKRHTMDVQDVAWSPDDRLLATCSIDNSICIWDVDTSNITPVMSQPLHTLSGHNGWVKGVAWDPVGKYLSSAGEDKTVRVWRVDTWKEAQVISEPFESCASTSHFRRLSWSPDGSMLCATHAFKSKRNIAALLDRSSWSDEVKFVGHQGVVTCARFNPKLIVQESVSDKEFACCAIGGDDATVSIWLAHLARPLAVVKDCFDAPVTDLSWSVQSSVLLASSLDGSICCFQFTTEEFGSPITDLQQSKLLQSKYGSRAGVTLASTFVENPLQLQLEEKSAPRRAAPPLAQPTVATTNMLVPKKKAKQTVNILQPAKKGDKKRIAPVLLGDESTSATASAQLNAASTANKIQNILGPTLPTLTDTALLDERMAGKPTSPVVASADGKTNVAMSSVQRPEVKRPREMSLKRKREGERVQSTAATNGAAIVAKAREVAPRAPKVLSQSNGADSGEVVPLLPEFPMRLSFNVDIDVASAAPTSTTSAPAARALVDVTAHNLKTSNEGELIELGPVYSTVKCSESGNIKWIDRVPGRVVSVTGNAKFFAIATSTGDLYVVSEAGRRLFPCIALGNPVSSMECSPYQSPYLMVILVNGAIKIWDISSRKLALNDSIEPLTTSSYSSSHRLTLLRSNVTPTGHPVVTFAMSNPESKGASSLQSFTFDPDMLSWMRVADDSFVYSDFHSSLATDAVLARDIPVGPLRRLQNASGYSRNQRGIASAMLKEMADPLTQRNVTRSHLEHQMATAIVLQSSREYLYWLQAYVRFLTADEDVARLDDLSAELLGPFHAQPSELQSSGTQSWLPQILDLSKRNLLRTHVLPTMATNRSLQRVVAKFQLMLDDMETRDREAKDPPSQESTTQAHVTTT